MANIDKGLIVLSDDYQEFKGRLNHFLQEVRKPLTERRETLQKVVESVEFVNSNLFTERFFERGGDDNIFYDKITSNMIKMMPYLIHDSPSAATLSDKLKDFIEVAEECYKHLKYLVTDSVVTNIFEGRIKPWGLISEYYKSKSLRTWIDILKFVQDKVVPSIDDSAQRSSFNEKVQTVEGLYIFVEQTTKRSLKITQKEFLGAVYLWATHYEG